MSDWNPDREWPLRLSCRGRSCCRAVRENQPTVGFGGSTIWFGSSAGVALSNMYPEAKSVGRWLRDGWPVAVAYVFGFFVMLAILGWKPDEPHKKRVDLPAIHVTMGNA
jgi:hypothetical protein